MPHTVPYGFEYEAPGEQPGRTLTGGPSGTEPILAVQVNDEIARVDSDIQDVADAAAEAALGWVPIGSGSVDAVTSFTIDVTAGGKYPAGTFSLVQLHLRGRLDTAAWLTMNVNNDHADNSHRRGWIRRIASDGSVDASGHGEASNARIGYWGSVFAANLLTCTLYNTDLSSNIGWSSTSGQQSGAANTHRITETWGQLTENRLLNTLWLGTAVPADAEYGPTRWWLTGWRDS